MRRQLSPTLPPRGCRASRDRGRGRSPCARGKPAPAPTGSTCLVGAAVIASAASSGEANQPIAEAASMAAPSAAASLTGDTESGRSSTLAMIRISSAELVPPPAAIIAAGLPPLSASIASLAMACSKAMPSSTARKRCFGSWSSDRPTIGAARRTIPIGAHDAGPIGHDQQAVAAGRDIDRKPSPVLPRKTRRWCARSSRPVACPSAARSPA